MDITPLLQAITGQGSTATPTTPWQQELLKAVNPEEARRQNIARSLASASQALATTPGNFLTGLTAGVTTGANSYVQGRDAIQQQRISAMQEIERAQQQDRDRQIQRMLQAFGIERQVENDQYSRGRDAIGDQRYKDETAYNRQRQGTADQLAAERVEIARKKAEASVTSGAAEADAAAGKPLTEWQKAQVRDRLMIRVENFQKGILEGVYTEDQRAEAERQIAAYREQVFRMQNFDPNTGQYLGATSNAAPQVQQPGAAQAPAAAATPAAKPDAAQVLQQAKDAIARGADPAAVRQRMIDNGYDPAGL